MEPKARGARWLEREKITKLLKMKASLWNDVISQTTELFSLLFYDVMNDNRLTQIFLKRIDSTKNEVGPGFWRKNIVICRQIVNNVRPLTKPKTKPINQKLDRTDVENQNRQLQYILGEAAPVLRLQCISSMAMAIPWRPSLARDGSAIVQLWHENILERKSFKLRNDMFMWWISKIKSNGRAEEYLKGRTE